jgi:Spy/CpxP family protein refolding chaperone
MERRKTMKKVLTILTVLLFLVIAASPSFAARGRGIGPGGGPCSDPTAIRGLNLTTEQTAKINSLREAHLKDVKPLQDKMFSKRGDLRLLWLEKNPDQAKIAAARKEIRSLRDQMQDKRDAYRLQVYNVLTPEQQTLFRSSCPGFGAGMGHGRGGGFGPGYGPGGGHGMRGDW